MPFESNLISYVEGNDLVILAYDDNHNLDGTVTVKNYGKKETVDANVIIKYGAEGDTVASIGIVLPEEEDEAEAKASETEKTTEKAADKAEA